MSYAQSIEQVCAALQASGVSPETAARFTWEGREAFRIKLGFKHPISDWRWARSLGLLRRRAREAAFSRLQGRAVA